MGIDARVGHSLKTKHHSPGTSAFFVDLGVLGEYGMLYTRFLPISRNKWSVSAPTVSAKPIAHITRRRGQCIATSVPDHALNREELSSVSVFMQERERAS